MRCEHRAVLLGLLLAVVVGCRKDGDTEGPVVTIIAPGTAYTAVMPDTVTVVAEISDNERIERVTVSITDLNGLPITPPFTVEPSATATTISVDMPLTSDLVVSGQHLVKVVASDGTNRGQAERVINVSAIPRRTRAVYLVTSPGFSPVQIYRIDSTGQLQPTPVASLPQDIAPSAISSKGRRLYVGAGVTGQLTALFPDDMSVIASLPSQNTLPIPFHTALHVGASGRLFAATNDELLQRYGTDLGGTGYSAQALNEHRVTGVLETTSAVMTTQQRFVSPGGYSLARYGTAVGVLQDAWTLDKAPVALFERNSDHVLVFGNRSGEGVVEDRNIVDGGYWEPRIFPNQILCVARMDANTYFVSMAGTLQRFNYSNASALTLVTGIAAEVMAYDEVNDVLITAEGGVVTYRDPSNGVGLGSFSVPAAVVNILPLYSR